MWVHNILMSAQETKRAIKMLNITAFFVPKQTGSEGLDESVDC